MKYAIVLGSGVIIPIQVFMKTGSGIQKLIGGDTQTHRQHGNRILLLLFFQNKESGLKSNQLRYLRRKEQEILRYRMLYTKQTEYQKREKKTERKYKGFEHQIQKINIYSTML
jgi:hypothetical protein